MKETNILEWDTINMQMTSDKINDHSLNQKKSSKLKIKKVSVEFNLEFNIKVILNN